MKRSWTFRRVTDEVVRTIEQESWVWDQWRTGYRGPRGGGSEVPPPWVHRDSDITVLRHLEKMGCRRMNRPQAILNCVNKSWTFQELAGHGVPLPGTFSYAGHENFSN